MPTSYSGISLFLPTYKRSEKLLTCITSAIRTAMHPERIKVLLCLSSDDIESKSAIESYEWLYDGMYDIIYRDTPAPNLPVYFNGLYDLHRSLGLADTHLVSMIGDDMVFVSRGWDDEILQTVNLADGKAIVYCDDGISQGRLATNLFLPCPIVEATCAPYMCPRYHADMIDLIWHWVGEYTGLLRYLGHVLIEHRHVITNPAYDDETNMRLTPIRKLYSVPEERAWARGYAAMIAARLVEAGYGKWACDVVSYA